MINVLGDEIIQIFKKYLKLEWFRCKGYGEINQLKYPPFMVWRFDPKKMTLDQIKNTEEKILAAVKQFEGNEEWSLYFAGRNWVLLPTKLKEFEEIGKYRVDVEAHKDFAEQHPEVSLKAILDLPKLAKHIEDYLIDK